MDGTGAVRAAEAAVGGDNPATSPLNHLSWIASSSRQLAE